MSEKMFNSYDDKPSPGADDLFLLWDNQESKIKNLKINNLSKYVKNKFPKKLPNPQSLTITYDGKTHVYDGSEAIAITIETSGIERVEKLSTDTTVTLEPNKLYIFPEMSSLTYTIGEGTGEVHFIFRSGATATTISCISSKFVGTINVKNSNPVFTDFNYGDEDTSTQAVLGNKTYMIKNYGSMKVRIPVAKKAVAKNGATIIKYIISVDGVAIDSYEKKYSDSSEILCKLGKYNTDGIGTISIYAIDSRGNVSDTVKKSFTVLPYSLPRFSVINLKRLNDYESEIVLDFQGVISKLSVNNVEKNTIKTVGYRYAEEGSSYPTNFSVINGVTVSSTPSEYILSFAQNTSDDTFGITGSGSSKLVLDNNKSYNFQFYIRDSFSNEDHYELNIEQGVPTMFIGDNKQVSVGMIPDITRDEKFQVATDILATNANGELVGILDLISKMIIPSDIEPVDQPNGGFWLKTSTIGEENIVG